MTKKEFLKKWSLRLEFKGVVYNQQQLQEFKEDLDDVVEYTKTPEVRITDNRHED